MTDDNDQPASVTGRNADADFLGEMIGLAAPQLVDLKVGSLTGCGYGEKSRDRFASATASASVTETRFGSVELRIPRLKTGSYFPEFLEPRHLPENALTAVVQEAYVQDVSTRLVYDLVTATGMPCCLSRTMSGPSRAAVTLRWKASHNEAMIPSSRRRTLQRDRPTPNRGSKRLCCRSYTIRWETIDGEAEGL